MIPLSSRAEIRLGFRCNARCGFCYYQDLLDTPAENEPTTKVLLDALKALRNNGATEIEFTGGEPTIKPDLPVLVRRARELGFVNVSIITNGLRVAKYEYAKRLADAGVNDILFSIHGHTAQLHDAHTGIPGSFDKILQAYGNMVALGVRCRISATVTGLNVHHVTDMFEFFLGLNASCLHFAVFSSVAQADGSDPSMHVSYSAAAKALMDAIDRFEPSLPPLSIKYIPYCFLPGYDRYVMNLYQQSFDPDDWNYYLSNKVRRAPGLFLGLAFDLVSLAGNALVRDRRLAARYGLKGLKVFGFTRLVELLRKKRLPACRQCKFDRVCDHVWRNYLAVNGGDEIVPIFGPKIRHPANTYVMSQYRSPGSALSETRQPAIDLIAVVNSE